MLAPGTAGEREEGGSRRQRSTQSQPVPKTAPHMPGLSWGCGGRWRAGARRGQLSKQLNLPNISENAGTFRRQLGINNKRYPYEQETETGPKSQQQGNELGM